MKTKPVFPIILCLCCACNLAALDGISFTVIASGKFGSGDLVRIDVKNGIPQSPVVYAKESVSQKSTSINMSGTFTAFNYLTGGNSYIAVADIETRKITPIKKAADAVHLWWLQNGNICYIDRKKYQLREISFSENGPAFDRYKTWFDYLPSKDYVDMSSDGNWLHMRVNSYKRGESKDMPDAVKERGRTFGMIVPGVPISRRVDGWPGLKGCGVGVSPSGNKIFYFIDGGHTIMHFLDGSQCTAYENSESYSFSTIASWAGGKVGTGGMYGNWAANSEKWAVVMVGCDGRTPSRGADQNLVNWKDKSAINITKFCRSGGKYARPGDFWCSSRDDVDDTLWHFVENREKRKKYWRDIFDEDFTIEDDNTVNAACRRNIAADAEPVSFHYSHGTLQIREENTSVRKVVLYALSGTVLYSGIVPAKGTISVAGYPHGRYICVVTNGAKKMEYRFVHFQ